MSIRKSTNLSIDDLAPSNTVYLNLSNYMYYQYNLAYSDTKLQAQIGFKPLTTANGKIVQTQIDKDGFNGEAFVSVNANGQVTKDSRVVIAYEGTNILARKNSDPGALDFTGGQIRDDADIIAGAQAPSFNDAAAFARHVISIAGNLGIKKSQVTVTGHSLGGANAEYAAKATGLGGATFAAPGIAGPAQAPANLTDYLDAADPLGNYGNHATQGGQPVSMWGSIVTLSPKINQYGSVKELVNASNEQGVSALNDAAMAYARFGAGSAFYKELALAGGLLSTLVPNGGSVSVTLPPFPTITINGLGFFHGLSQYASDLDVPLYLPDATCFAGGTRIRVVRGGAVEDVAVEALVVGDLAVTSSGAVRPIRWLGHRRIDCGAHPEPARVHPVRIAAHAFGADRPVRDLYLSPGHPVLVGVGEDDQDKGDGGHLVPIMCLINGTTIARVPVDEVTYWHVELDAHDILLAEGLQAESYLDWGDRAFFTEGASHALANPDFVVPGLAGRCRPVAVDGPVVEAERRRLDGVFVMRLTSACDWHGTEATLGF